MQTFACPHGDGSCSAPDPAVVVTRGLLSLVRTDVLDRLLTEMVLVEQLLPIELSYDEVRELAVEQLQSPRDEAELVENEMSTDDGIIVQCSCGHIWLWPTAPKT